MCYHFASNVKGADLYRLSKVINKSKMYRELFEHALSYDDRDQLNFIITEEISKKAKRKAKTNKSN